jgi:hypothetical protein
VSANSRLLQGGQDEEQLLDDQDRQNAMNWQSDRPLRVWTSRSILCIGAVATLYVLRDHTVSRAALLRIRSLLIPYPELSGRTADRSSRSISCHSHQYPLFNNYLRSVLFSDILSSDMACRIATGEQYSHARIYICEIIGWQVCGFIIFRVSSANYVHCSFSTISFRAALSINICPVHYRQP